MIETRHIFNFSTKEPIGLIKNTNSFLFASNIKDACAKFVDMIDPEFVENNKEYINEKINLHTLASEKYAILEFDYNGRQIKAFIDRREESYTR